VNELPDREPPPTQAPEQPDDLGGDHQMRDLVRHMERVQRSDHGPDSQLFLEELAGAVQSPLIAIAESFEELLRDWCSGPIRVEWVGLSPADPCWPPSDTQPTVAPDADPPRLVPAGDCYRWLGPVVVQVDATLALAMVESMLGGDPRRSDLQPRPLTPVEAKLCDRVIEHFGGHWIHRFAAAGVRHGSLSSNRRRGSTAEEADEVSVTDPAEFEIRFQVHVGDLAGTWSVFVSRQSLLLACERPDRSEVGVCSIAVRIPGPTVDAATLRGLGTPAAAVDRLYRTFTAGAPGFQRPEEDER